MAKEERTASNSTRNINNYIVLDDDDGDDDGADAASPPALTDASTATPAESGISTPQLLPNAAAQPQSLIPPTQATRAGKGTAKGVKRAPSSSTHATASEMRKKARKDASGGFGCGVLKRDIA